MPKKQGNASMAIVAVLVLAAFAYSVIQMQLPTSGNDIKKFSSYDELASYLEDSGEYGYYGSGAVSEQMAITKSEVSESGDSRARAAAPDYSRTNIQVEGVDEADIVKTDGKYIYAVSGNKVIILDAYPAENAEIASQIEFNGTVSEIFISNNRLVVFGQKNYEYGKPGLYAPEMRPTYYSPRTFIDVYDVSDKGSPSLARNVSVDGSYYDSRMIGDYIYLIANQPVHNYGGPVPLPVLYFNGVAREIPATDIYYFGIPDNSFIFTNIVSLNTQSNEEPSSKTFLMGYSQSMYLSQDNIYIVYQKRVNEFNYYDRIIDEIIMPIVPSDIQDKISHARNSNASKYDKMQQIGKIFEDYLRTLNPEQAADIMKAGEEKALKIQAEIAEEMEKTVIHKISVDNGKIEYKTNGEVPGHVLNQFSMDEYKGYFRIATTTSNSALVISATGTAISQTAEQTTPTRTVAPPSNPNGQQNHVYVLDGDMKIVGKLEDLAGGERIYSVRFLQDKAYMVTFRQVDPLFVIDLSSPSNPKILGYLKIPGVSDYLHPYDETHVIGIGRDATEEGRIQGMKLSLFDVSDVANPKEVSKYIIGERGTDSESLRDHKAFLFSREKNLLVIPVSEYRNAPRTGALEGMETWRPEYWQGAYVFNLDLENGFVLKGKITHQSESRQDYDYNSPIRRSLYIDNVLYTVSQSLIKMNGLDNLKEINKVNLPFDEQKPYVGMIE